MPKGSKTVTGEPRNVIDVDPTLSLDDNRMAGVSEGLSLIQRLKRRQTMRKYENRLGMTRERAMKRRANLPVLRRRARKMATNRLKTKFAGGRDIKKLSSAEKSRLEDMLKKRKALVSRLADRLVKDERKIENKRLSNSFVPGFTDDFDINEIAELADLITFDLTEGVNEDTLLTKSRSYDIPFNTLRAVYEGAILHGDEYTSAAVNAFIIREKREEVLHGRHIIEATFSDDDGNVNTSHFATTADSVSKAINRVSLHLADMGVKVHELKKA